MIFKIIAMENKERELDRIVDVLSKEVRKFETEAVTKDIFRKVFLSLKILQYEG